MFHCRSIGDVLFHAMDRSVLSRTITEFTDILENVICPKWIKYPNSEEQISFKQIFFKKTKFPGVIGCVDCTHVNIIAPQENEHLYVDRKGNHSLNVQLVSHSFKRYNFEIETLNIFLQVCNYDLKILSVNARYPGSTHDSGIWAVSADRRKMEKDYINGKRNTVLLGDSGYPLEPWLITPFRNPNPQQARFNHIHAKARNPIERCNGVLKGTFRCLLGERQLRYEPAKVLKIVNVCCALLNICLYYKAPLVEEVMPEEINNILYNFNDNLFNATDIRQSIMGSIL